MSQGLFLVRFFNKHTFIFLKSLSELGILFLGRIQAKNIEPPGVMEGWIFHLPGIEKAG